ncbi:MULTISPECIES: OprO/OprP family phosphate-selective porin [unclassified Microbulbifer]|uniref:OprO/OprP family phosphate-selective porin n=1 Tax=unclassified Microbulbifer TaxID=2619833 RepID=UPI001E2EE39F|nr:porin [Microbulbifer sp. YPW16]UHQ55283.1 OprO/OprP family phosphate-selective porin [Microbulbifer sp. YPW16]
MDTRKLILPLLTPAWLGLSFIPAHADTAKTSGGLEIVSDDGNFSAELGGRIHFDTYLFDTDIDDPVSTTEFRRARITLTGEAYNWEYKLEQDFAAGDTLAGFREVWIGHDFYGGQIRVGQFKPFRAMEELTSSNEILMLERPFTTATGIYDGRQFQQGIGWNNYWDCYTAGIMAFNLRNADTPRNEGVGAAGRFTWAPINNELSTIHLGASYSYENANRETEPFEADADYAGRRGPSQLIALTPGDEEFFFGDFGDDEFFLGSQGGAVHITGLELAGTWGPFYAQMEYAYGDYEGEYSVSEIFFEDLFDAPPTFECDPDFGCFIGDQDVHAWYIQGSWLITGEHKPYNSKKGVFKSAKPSSPWGAWELTARYESIQNDEIPDLEADSWIVGVNYYHNPKVRFMLNLRFGDDDFTGDGTDQLGIRAQMSW